MRTIFRTEFGSSVYGTRVPTSDTDYKSIFIPSAKSIILQQAPQHLLNNTKTDSTARNSSTDIDEEAFSVQRFFKLLTEGQTVSLDLLFTPKNHWTFSSEPWEAIQNNRDKFLHKGSSAFIGYTKSQASKYGIKGFRVRALKDTLDLLSQFPEYSRLEDHLPKLMGFVYQRPCKNPTPKTEHIDFVTIKAPNGKEELHLKVCNRKLSLKATVKYVREILEKIYAEYGHRALLAERNEGLDRKSLMHAVRVAKEAEELLLTGNITFPRPEKDLLLQIRKGELSYKEVEAIIEQGLEDTTNAQLRSTLPDKPNTQLMEDIVFDLYHRHVIMNLE